MQMSRARRAAPSRTSWLTAAALAGLAVMPAGCGTIIAQAPPVRPALVVADSRGATFTVLRGPPEEDLCSSFGVRSVCVRGIGDEMRRGVGTILGASMTSATGDVDYVADFRAQALDMRRRSWTNGVTPSFRWRFTLRRRDGRVVIDLQETTTAPKELPFDGDGRAALVTVETITLERIRQIVAELGREAPPAL